MSDQSNLSPAAFEAGAKALFMRERKYHQPTVEYPEPPSWEDLTETSLEHYRGNARAVLAAVLPTVHRFSWTVAALRANFEWGGQVRLDPAEFDRVLANVRAEALEEAALNTPVRWDFPPHASALEIRPWLRGRAAQIRKETKTE